MSYIGTCERCKAGGKSLCTDDKYCPLVDVLVIYDAEDKPHFLNRKTGELISDTTGLKVGERPMNCWGWFADSVLTQNNLPRIMTHFAQAPQ